jgi:hypothetical protein
MNLDVIMKIISDAGLGVEGSTLFQHRMPAEKKTGILLRNPLDGIPINPELPDYVRGKLQVIVRNSDQGKGDQLSNKIMKLLTIYNKDYSDADGHLLVSIKQMYPSTLPVVYPRSDGNGIEWSINFDYSAVIPQS